MNLSSRQIFNKNSCHFNQKQQIELSDSPDIASSIAINFHISVFGYSNITPSPSGLSCITMNNSSLIATSLVVKFYFAIVHRNNNHCLRHINIRRNGIVMNYCSLITTSLVVKLCSTICNFNDIHSFLN